MRNTRWSGKKARTGRFRKVVPPAIPKIKGLKIARDNDPDDPRGYIYTVTCLDGCSIKEVKEKDWRVPKIPTCRRVFKPVEEIDITAAFYSILRRRHWTIIRGGANLKIQTIQFFKFSSFIAQLKEAWAGEPSDYVPDPTSVDLITYGENKEKGQLVYKEAEEGSIWPNIEEILENDS